MAYLSELLGRQVHDAKGTHIGTLDDVLITSETNGDPYPRIVALAVRHASRQPTLLPWGGTEDLAGNKIILQRPSATDYQPKGNELFLNRDVMDKQVIDINGSRVVRVNDLEFAKIGDDYRLVNVDIGLSGLLRRLGWEDAFDHFAEQFHRALPARSIRFNDLEFVPRGDLKVSVRPVHGSRPLGGRGHWQRARR